MTPTQERRMLTLWLTVSLAGLALWACLLEGRDFIGIELEHPSYVIAQRRIQAAQSEMVQLELEG